MVRSQWRKGTWRGRGVNESKGRRDQRYVRVWERGGEERI